MEAALLSSYSSSRITHSILLLKVDVKRMQMFASKLFIPEMFLTFISNRYIRCCFIYACLVCFISIYGKQGHLRKLFEIFVTIFGSCLLTYVYVQGTGYRHLKSEIHASLCNPSFNLEEIKVFC